MKACFPKTYNPYFPAAFQIFFNKIFSLKKFFKKAETISVENYENHIYGCLFVK